MKKGRLRIIAISTKLKNIVSRETHVMQKEIIRRYISHILARHFNKMGYYGLLSNVIRDTTTKV
ncbi:MAG: transposase [Arsenophonus sp. NC-CH8-MAG3]